MRDKLIIPALLLALGCGGRPAGPQPAEHDTIPTGSVEAAVFVMPQAGAVVDTDSYDSFETDSFFTVSELSDSLYATMEGVSIRRGAPVTRAMLRDVRVLHHDFDGNVRSGRIICNKSVAEDLLEIFRELYEAGYPVERIMPVDNYGGDDNESMKANNTSCFNYRPTPGGSRLSYHAYGTAIDVNPLYNPYVRRTRGGVVVLPPEGKPYADRSLGARGMMGADDTCVLIFKKHGFRWGGDWRRGTRDYQHFEKKPK